MNDAQSFADLKFRIECSQIALSKVGGAAPVVVGPGEIWQDKDGRLQFKIFANGVGFVQLQEIMQRKPVGQLMQDEDYFSLQAVEYALPHWSAQQIIPIWRGNARDSIVHGQFHELVNSQPLPANSKLYEILLRFKGRLEFPCNQETMTQTSVGGQIRKFSGSTNAATTEADGFKFELAQEGDHTRVNLVPPLGKLTAASAVRLQEALQFVLGQQLVLLTTESYADGQHVTRLTSPFTPGREQGKMSPPLAFQRIAQDDNMWQMFTTYFRHIHANIDPGWHPISRHLSSALESTAASLDAEVLALAVAVEGLIGDCFPDLAPVPPEFLDELNRAESALRGAGLSEKTRKRIEGSLGSMRKTRNSDLLHAFITKNNLSKKIYDSWSSLRHTSAHGGRDGGREIERTLQLMNEVLSLMYSIVFAVIKYSGPRTDYSLPGFPESVWPIPAPLADAPPGE